MSANQHIGSTLDELFESLGELDEVRARAFWMSLTPAQRFDVLSVAPKTLGPWTEETPIFGDPGEEWSRRQPLFNGCRVRQAVVKVTKRGDVAWSSGIRNGIASTVAAAKTAADESLVKDEWSLVGWRAK